MRTIGVLLGVSMMAVTGCLTLSTIDTSNTGGGGMGGSGMGQSSSTGPGGSGASGGMMNSSSSSSGAMASSSSSGGGSGGGGCVSNTPCNTGKLGICSAGFTSCDDPMLCIQTIQPIPEKCAMPGEDENCDGKNDCTGDTIFDEGYGQVGVQRGRDVAVDSQGNVVVTGYFAGSMNLGGGILAAMGANDIFVAKFDSAGNHLWSKRFGDSAEQQARGVAVDSNDDVYIGGFIEGTLTFGNTVLTASATGGDAFIAKLDSNGNPLWVKYAQADGIQLFDDVATDSSGNVVGVGSLQGTADFGSGVVGTSGEDDVLVVKYAKDGTNSWSRSFGNSFTHESASAVDVDSTGAIYVTGKMDAATDFGNGTIQHGGDFDAFLVKLNSQGKAVWSNGFGDAKAQVGIDIAVDVLDNVILSMTFGGTINLGGQAFTAAGTNIDSALAKFNSAGQHQWSKNLKATMDKGGVFIDTDGAGNIVATCSFLGPIDFGTGGVIPMGTDMAFAKLDFMGNGAFTHNYGSAGSVVTPHGIAAGRLGQSWVTGTYSGNVNFGQGTLIAPNSDMFLVGFSP